MKTVIAPQGLSRSYGIKSINGIARSPKGATRQSPLEKPRLLRLRLAMTSYGLDLRRLMKLLLLTKMSFPHVRQTSRTNPLRSIADFQRESNRFPSHRDCSMVGNTLVVPIKVRQTSRRIRHALPAKRHCFAVWRTFEDDRSQL